MLKTTKKGASKAEEEAKKRRKKLAKREAELMLKVEQARKDLRKAEQRLTRARTGLETAQSELQNTELEIAELRAPAQEAVSAEPAVAQTEEQASLQDEHKNEESPDTEQLVGPPPVEGRVDITEEQPADEGSHKETAEPAEEAHTQTASMSEAEEKTEA